MKKIGCLDIIIIGVVLLFFVTVFGPKKDPLAPMQTTDKLSMDFRASPDECAKIGGIVERNFTGPQYSNPKPGVFYMPTVLWTSLSKTERETIGKAMAFQKACAFDGNPNLVTVEIRSRGSNKLLATGAYWDLRDQ